MKEMKEKKMSGKKCMGSESGKMGMHGGYSKEMEASHYTKGFKAGAKAGGKMKK